MEILLSGTVDFEVDVHLPVLEEARLEHKQRGLLRAPWAFLPAGGGPAQTLPLLTLGIPWNRARQ